MENKINKQCESVKSVSNFSASDAARCLALLSGGHRWMTAVELAAALELSGSRETQRRKVRAIIEYLRSQGSMIIANLTDGYFLTSDSVIYREYLEGRQIDAKRVLAVSNRQSKGILDSKGQNLLFDSRVQCGCATIGGNL